jgi:uncharacterized protein (TIGR00730 family)
MRAALPEDELMEPIPQKHETEKLVPGVDPLEPNSVRRSPTRQRVRRRAGSGDPAIDRAIADLLTGIDAPNEDLLQDTLETVFRIARTANRGEVKLVRRSLHELGRAFRVFAPYRGVRKASIFGSARTAIDDPDYVLGRAFSVAIAERGWMVITGAGPGIMAAGHEGAGKKQSFGVGIKLPMEQSANTFIAGDPKLIDFKYFFTRKVTFMKESDAFVLMPGGYGTMDEGFELLTLMQTGKTAIRPVILLEHEGGDYWRNWIHFVETQLVERGLCSREDMSLFETADSKEEAVAALERFYRNYDSARYVGERLVLRMKRAPSPGQLAELNRGFRDVVARGHIDAIGITAAEARDNDAVELERIAYQPRHNFGRIRQLIDAVNQF